MTQFKLAYLTFLFLLTCSVIAQAQDGGGEYAPEKGVCLTSDQRQQIIDDNLAILANSADMFEQYLAERRASRSQEDGFIWPVEQIGETKDPGFYAISNYVDHESLISESINSLLDYNCGHRTYDVPGYNHSGTDIFTWPFPWIKMDTDDVAVIAAMDGIVITTYNGNDDRSCEFCTNCFWNAVYLLHEDGTVGWYGHLKKYSIPDHFTSGMEVSQGEYLGILASSGNSTGPHLHFELWEDQTYSKILDPFSGICNNDIFRSLWNEQKAYRNPRVNLLTTGWAPPVDYQCDIPWEPNRSNQFLAGDDIYYTIYLADEIPNTPIELSVVDPTGVVIDSWRRSGNVTFSASYWYWVRRMAYTADEGIYTFRVNYNGKTTETQFQLGGVSSQSDGVSDSQPAVWHYNPSSRSIVLNSLKASSNTHIDIYSLSGQLIERLNFNGISAIIPELPSALYIIRLKSGERHIDGALIFLE